MMTYRPTDQWESGADQRERRRVWTFSEARIGLRFLEHTVRKMISERLPLLKTGCWAGLLRWGWGLGMVGRSRPRGSAALQRLGEGVAVRDGGAGG